MLHQFTHSKIWVTWGRVGLIGLGLLLGLLAGAGAILGVAALSDAPALFLLSGLVTFALIATGSAALATRRLAASRRRRWRLSVWSVEAAIAILVAIALLVPLHDPVVPAAAVPDQRFWDLPTGSRIAYVKIPAVGVPKPTPIIFVHGGPGVPMMAEDARFFGRLSQYGYDVYLYDQTGAGLSPRLDDPTQYTIARHVADLEAIRQRIGAERVILIGHSWGGTIAATYLAEHAEHVEKVIFSAPGALYWPDMGTSGNGMLGRLSGQQRWQVIEDMLSLRGFLAYELVQVNPRAAHAFAGDREMDAHFDRMFAHAAPGLFCNVNAPPEGAVSGLGFYANGVPQSASAPPPVDPRPALRTVRTPALVLKGSCDYLPWQMTMEYRNTLPNARLVYVSGAEHQIYQEQPELYLRTVLAFLQDKPLPIQPYAGQEPPPDYTGVR